MVLAMVLACKGRFFVPSPLLFPIVKPFARFGRVYAPLSAKSVYEIAEVIGV